MSASATEGIAAEVSLRPIDPKIAGYEAAVAKREQARIAKARAGDAIDAAKLAYETASDAVSAADDEVFAARAALRAAP